MLGRLFKQQQSPAPSPLNPPQGPAKPAPASANSYEDSYTREILYGSSSLSQIRPHSFSRRRFRLVVAQDGGNLRSKQVLFDSADRQDSGLGSAPGSGPHSEAPSPSRPRSQSDNKSNLQSPTMSTPASPKTEDDSLQQSLSNLSFSRGSASKNILTTKLLHNASELNEYMFGRGLPSSESHTATKVHLLPQFNSVHGSFSAVLVTKLFSIPDNGGIMGETSHDTDPSWSPTPTFPIRETSYSFPSSLSSNQASSSPESPSLGVSKYTVNSRFAIGIVIPYSQEQSVDEVVLQNWEVLSQYLVSLQKLVTKKLLMVINYSTVNGMCPYIANRRISFPSELLQADSELPRQLHKLYRLIHFNYNTPRLINSNSIMRYSASHADSRFKALLVNWALEVINWLEFKDGRNIVSSNHPNFASNAHFHNYSHNHHNLHSHGVHNEFEGVPSNTFLASLFALLHSLRDSLSQTSSETSANRDSKEVTRILVVTGNSIVAKKLIFILNGLIPDAQFEACISDEDYKRSLQYTDSNDTTDAENFTSPSSQETFYNYSHCAADRSKRVTTPFSDPSATPGSIPETASIRELSRTPEIGSTPMAQPIPIKKGNHARDSIAGSSDESLSVSVSSQRGWEVPGKSGPAASVSFAERPVLETSHSTTQHIPIHGKPAMSTSSSMAQLSSSLNSSLSSSASNYSFSKFGSSFLDKWRNSFVPGPNNLQEPHHHIHEGFDHQHAPDLSKRPSYHSLNSPSPAIEQDDFQWDAATTATSRGRAKLSRAQSMLDLFNLTSPVEGQSSHSTEFPALNLKRSRGAMVVPLANDHARGLVDVSRDAIHRKCERVMDAKLTYGELNNNTMEVNFDSHDDEKVYKQRPLLPNVAFVEEFRPEYTMQSCPVSSKLEAQVTTAMKNDLLFYHNDCGYSKVTTRSVVISLRAREIKVIEMNVGDKNGKGRSSSTPAGWVAPAPAFSHGHTTPPVSSHSPTSSYFHGYHEHNHTNGSHGNGDKGTSYKTTIRKVFTPHRNSGDREQINRIESLLDRLTEVVAKINAYNNEGASDETMKDLNGKLFTTVSSLLQ
ncbi:hypothetical protein FT663_01473 [Candidozyma haemuli var. vulneris]|nr:hypothetical protein FT662_01598 [[Candida] haemuloni var. vulneris]KAF3994454.1 hypothetical protein FT663_01473 [[Candida] haemuloni var. vulneris]